MLHQVGNVCKETSKPSCFGLDSVRFDAFINNLSLDNL